MNLKEIYEELKKIYPEANALDGGTNQSGLFIALDRVVPVSYQKDTVYFRLIIDCVSFDRSSDAIFSFIDELRERTIKAESIFAMDIFEGISFDKIDENGHYAYILNLKIDAYRDIPNEVLEREC
ncbi:hypothetical protein [Campylobacter hyointestinalis]|uniref:hypothetical protein n=1 Tax=Campylobacter hyointestinalis TaxID=198 RepID=UPI000DCEA798|nr:hypothetical protein [Campylobacter hyointestinalis]RAZ54556.1 hypothetical protein CHL10074_07030 [Campylobacter hyointestinalis subsp. lawsonii]RAZ62914.1 hypothetical protein CHL9767_07825 [Campylobacter hyointestinalis subsp. lawsonii]